METNQTRLCINISGGHAYKHTHTQACLLSTGHTQIFITHRYSQMFILIKAILGPSARTWMGRVTMYQQRKQTSVFLLAIMFAGDIGWMWAHGWASGTTALTVSLFLCARARVLLLSLNVNPWPLAGCSLKTPDERLPHLLSGSTKGAPPVDGRGAYQWASSRKVRLGLAAAWNKTCSLGQRRSSVVLLAFWGWNVEASSLSRIPPQ